MPTYTFYNSRLTYLFERLEEDTGGAHWLEELADIVKTLEHGIDESLAELDYQTQLALNYKKELDRIINTRG